MLGFLVLILLIVALVFVPSENYKILKTEETLKLQVSQDYFNPCLSLKDKKYRGYINKKINQQFFPMKVVFSLSGELELEENIFPEEYSSRGIKGSLDLRSFDVQDSSESYSFSRIGHKNDYYTMFYQTKGALFELPRLSKHEKNWTFFQHNNQLYCEYSLFPHKVFEIQENRIIQEYVTGNKNDKILHRMTTSPIPWKQGEFLAIGHRETFGLMLNYLHFFYTFSSEPPFKITKMSKYFKLNKNSSVQFILGLQDLEKKVLISYGVNDKDNYVAYLSKEKISSLLNKKSL